MNKNNINKNILLDWSPLFYSLNMSFKDNIIEFLINLNSDINKKFENNCTCLMKAIKNRYKEEKIIKLLINKKQI